MSQKSCSAKCRRHNHSDNYTHPQRRNYSQYTFFQKLPRVFTSLHRRRHQKAAYAKQHNNTVPPIEYRRHFLQSYMSEYVQSHNIKRTVQSKHIKTVVRKIKFNLFFYLVHHFTPILFVVYSYYMS